MLQRLDISGTNLAQEWVLEEGKDEETNTRSIAGLEEARLDFLGLQDCWGNPCSWEKLPAEQVKCRALFQNSGHFSRYRDSHYKDNVVTGMSFLSLYM